MAGPWDKYAPAASSGPWDKYATEEPSVALDIAKQIPTGLAIGVENIPAAVPSALGWIGEQVEKVFPPNPADVARREELKALIAAQRGGGIAQYLPEAETTAGKYARSAAEAVPGMVGASKLNPLRAAGAGATSGLVSEAAGQATEGTEWEPYARGVGALI